VYLGIDFEDKTYYAGTKDDGDYSKAWFDQKKVIDM
jgi:hypothetical protein